MKNRKQFLGLLLSFLLICYSLVNPDILHATSIKDTTYYVQFNSNGGAYVSPIYNIQYGDTIDMPTNPYRYNYWFRGWYSDSSFTTPFDNSTPVYHNTILYAKWEQKSSTPNIMSQSISDDTTSATVTIDITGQTYGSGCKMNLITYSKSTLQTVVYTVNKTSNYIGFELNIDDFVFSTSTPIPVKISIPSTFNSGCTQILYTTDMTTVAGIPDGYVNSDGQYVFDAYYSGTYILMEAADDTSSSETESPSLSMTMASTLKVNNQYSSVCKIMNYTGDDSDYTLEWYSSKPYIASATKDGIITGKSPGRTTISCVSTDGTLVAKKIITVYKTKITSMSTNVSSKKIINGKTFQINVTVKPSTASKKTVTYTSSNTAIAKVSSTGKVTAKAIGTCKITIHSTDGSNKTKTVKITVV